MKKIIINRIIVCFSLIGLVIGSIEAISYVSIMIIHYPETLTSLEKAWQWVENQVKQYKDGYWIGYSIKRLMPKNSYIGSSCGYDTGKPSLKTILQQNHTGSQSRDKEEISVKKEAEKALKMHQSCNEKVIKKVALLFYFKDNIPEIENMEKLRMTNISQYFDLENKSLFWLGESKKEASIKFLKKSYHLTYQPDIKKELITSIALHQTSPLVIEFLSNITKHEDNPELRNNAVFWLSQQETDEVIPHILNVIQKDPSQKVREQAVFAISQIESDKALDILIDLAKNSNNKHIQKQAIFWLGQKACEISAEILEEIAYDSEQIEIQKQAIFALSQLNDDEGIPNIIKIAKNHPAIEVRKNAIFWLGQSNNKEALEALISIVQKNNDTESH